MKCVLCRLCLFFFSSLSDKLSSFFTFMSGDSENTQEVVRIVGNLISELRYEPAHEIMVLIA